MNRREFILKALLQTGKELLNSINGTSLFLLSWFSFLPVFLIVKDFFHNLPTEILAGFIVLGALILIFCDKKSTGRLKRKTTNWLSLISLLITLCIFILIDQPSWWLRLLGDLSLPILAINVVILLFVFILCFSIGKLSANLSNKYQSSNLTCFVSGVYGVGLVTFSADISQQKLVLLFAVTFFIMLWRTIAIKRFHDLNQASTDCFGLLVPFYNIYLLYRLIFVKGTKGENKYGPDPLAKSEISQSL